MNELFSILNNEPSLLFGSVFVLGLLIGSFLNVVVFRLPKMLEQDWKHQCQILLEQTPQTTSDTLTLSKPASTCPHCGHKIRAWENIPVISYLFLRGKCSNCSAKISIRYPLVELATALLSLAVAWKFGASYAGFACLVFTWVLISLTLIDADTTLLPDNLTLPLMWLGLIANYFGLITSLESALWGAIWGYMSLWSVYQLFKLLTGKEGMGFGDFKLLAALGAWLGWEMLPMIILLSSAVGAIIGISMTLFRGRDKNVPMPFGPYLAIAGWLALIWGTQITQAWLSLF